MPPEPWMWCIPLACWLVPIFYLIAFFKNAENDRHHWLVQFSLSFMLSVLMNAGMLAWQVGYRELMIVFMGPGAFGWSWPIIRGYKRAVARSAKH